jgi:hypothetical protein
MKKILLFLVSANFLFSIDVFKYNGTAVDLKTGKKLYSDFHEEYSSNGKHLYSVVNYKDPSGKIFAKKNIDFQKNGARANFKLEDFRDGYIEGSEVIGNSNKAKFIFKKNSTEELKEEILETPVPSVFDGGFDIYMKDNWAAIMEGKRKTFSICAPSQMDCFKFAAFKTGEELYKEKEAVVVRVELNSFILSKLVKPIIITYDKNTKRILQFDGISNINNENGKSYVVRITYEY